MAVVRLRKSELEMIKTAAERKAVRSRSEFSVDPAKVNLVEDEETVGGTSDGLSAAGTVHFK